MNDIISVQLAISKLHLQSLVEQESGDPIATQAIAELNTALVELEAVNADLLQQNEEFCKVNEARESEARRYRELFEQIPVAYVITDGWGVITETNAAAEELLNVTRVVLRGKPISVFVQPAERRAFRDSINQISKHAGWQSTFQPRGRDRISVQLDVSEVTPGSPADRQLGWVIQNLSPQLAAASAEKMLARETHMRLEAQAAVLRLRALNVGLETMAHDVDLPIRHRVTSLLEALVPRFASQMSCHLPTEPEEPIVIGSAGVEDQTLQTVVLCPNNAEGRLVARRNGAFSAEDGAILQSAANGVSLLLYAARRIGSMVHAT